MTPDEDSQRTGLLWLHYGSASRAVRALERAAEDNPGASVLCDLSAAYLALAPDDPAHLVDALVAASRAVALAPHEPGAVFNQALAFEKLSLIRAAHQGWKRYLEIEPDPAWRAEAVEHLKLLDAPTTASRWDATKAHILSSGTTLNSKTVERFIRDFPAEIRKVFETEWLPQAAASLGPATGKENFATANLWAQAFAKGGEHLYADSLAALEKAESAISVRRQAEGLRLYAEGLNNRSNCSLAEPALERAEGLLTQAHNPMALAARLERLVCLYRPSPKIAEGLFAGLSQALAKLPYPTLAAKTEKMSGLCAMADGRYSQAIAHYRRAANLWQGRGEGDTAYIHGMLDEAYRFLGDRAEMWRHRLLALGGATAAGDFRLRHSVLFGMAQELAEAGRGQAVQPVLDEMFDNAHAWGEPGAEAETLLRRIQLHLANGKIDLAAADITACERVVKGFKQPADRARLEAELKVGSAEQKVGDHPAEAQRETEDAVASFISLGEGLLLPRALLTLARADLALGDLAGAEEAFRRTLHLYEERRESTLGEEERIYFFATAQKSFDAMIRFQAVDRGDAAAALRYAEQARVRGLRDHFDPRSGRAAADLDLAALLRRLPPDVAAFEFAVLPDRLLVWRLFRGSLDQHVLPTSREKVARTVASLRSTLRNATSVESARAAAGEAYEAMLAPALAGVPPGTELVFVPDRELHQLPFAALFDTHQGHFLVEDHPSFVTPSLGTYLSALDRAKRTPRKLQRVLSVGEPAIDIRRFPDLAPLPSARKESETIAALYPEATLLTGKEASRAKILAAFPGSDVVHLAAHALIDSRKPLSSIVATADPGTAVLNASDLDARRLAGIQLVFLAACDTAPGFVDGDREGVAGLARAVLAAGVPSVVATLWPVGDQSTAGLPQRFHARLLAGNSSSKALQGAQLALLSRRSSPRPFAWAPFQLFGGV